MQQKLLVRSLEAAVRPLGGGVERLEPDECRLSLGAFGRDRVGVRGRSRRRKRGDDPTDEQRR